MRFFITALGCLFAFFPVHAETRWTAFRGHDGSGHAPDADLPTAVDESVVRWSIPIHGRGWSSPVIDGDRVWLTTATERGDERSVLCVDRFTGEVLIDKVVLRQDDPPFCYPANSQASPTPVVDGDRVIVHFGSSLTACLDTKTGDEVWRRTDLQCDHYRGAASSPIIAGGKVIVAFDGFDVQYIVALDLKTGETVWRQDRNIDYGTDNGDRMKAYSTAAVFDFGGRSQVISPSAMATKAYDLDSGELIWTAYHDGMNASSRPVRDGDRVILTNGSGTMVAIKLGGTGDITGTHIDWAERKSVPKKASPIIVDGLIYANSDDGVISCRDVATGEVLWSKRKGGEFGASPVFAGGYLYFVSIEGDVITVRPGREFDLVAETKLGDGFMASPAVAEDAMYLRSKSMLYCIAKHSLKD